MIWVILLAACVPKSTEESSTPLSGPTPDPDVETWVPEAFPPTGAERIVFFGDSITAVYGLNNPDNGYPSLLLGEDSDRWPEHEGGDLVDRFGALDVLDISRDGATTDTVLSSQLPGVEAAWGPVISGPTLVVGTIGGNDALNALLSADSFEETRAQMIDNLSRIVDFFQDEARFPDGSYLYLTNVYEPTDGTGQVPECFYGLDMTLVLPELEATNEAMLGLAQEQGWAWVDLHGHFLGHGFRHEDPNVAQHDDEDPSLWLQDDCIHPNARGHHEIRRLFLAAVDAEPLALP